MTNNLTGRGGLNGIAFALLWLFIFCVPWDEQILLPDHIALSHFIGAGAAAAGVLACLSSRRIRRPGAMHYLAAALVAWSVLSYSWTIAPELTAVRAGSYAQLLFMVWLIWEFAPDDDRQMSLLGAYVMGSWVAVIGTFYSFATGTGPNRGLAEGRYTAGSENENELGIILALSLGMSCYLLARKKGPRVLWFLHVPACLMAILLTGSRGSFIAAVVALLVFPFSLGSFSGTEKKLGGLALVAITALGLTLVPRATWDRIGTIQAEMIPEGTLTKRTYIWSAGLEAYRGHPVAGVGAGAFEAGVVRRLDIAYVAHNSYLSVLVELGAVGLILFLALLASLFHAALTLPKTSRTAWFFLLLTWSVAVLSLTWEHRKPTWFLFGLLMAQSAALRRPRFPAPELAADRFRFAPGFAPRARLLQ